MIKKPTLTYPREKYEDLFMYNDIFSYYRFSFPSNSGIRKLIEIIDKRAFYLISLSKDKEDYPPITDVNGMNIYFLWASIYQVIKSEIESPKNQILKKRVIQLKRAEVFTFLVVLDYISGYYSNYGTEKDTLFLMTSSNIFENFKHEFATIPFRKQLDMFTDLLGFCLDNYQKVLYLR